MEAAHSRNPVRALHCRRRRRRQRRGFPPPRLLRARRLILLDGPARSTPTRAIGPAAVAVAAAVLLRLRSLHSKRPLQRSTLAPRRLLPPPPRSTRRVINPGRWMSKPLPRQNWPDSDSISSRPSPLFLRSTRRRRRRGRALITTTWTEASSGSVSSPRPCRVLCRLYRHSRTLGRPRRSEDCPR